MGNGYADLSRQVIKQWVIDGKPSADLSSIQIWEAILSEHAKFAALGEIKQCNIGDLEYERFE